MKNTAHYVFGRELVIIFLVRFERKRFDGIIVTGIM